jgi:hypothetical protein
MVDTVSAFRSVSTKPGKALSDLHLEMATAKRFTGLRLSDEDRAALKKRQTGRVRMSAGAWRRVRILLLLDRGFTVTGAAEAVGTYRRETARVGKRYLAGGLEHALSDDAAPIAGTPARQHAGGRCRGDGLRPPRPRAGHAGQFPVPPADLRV